MAVEFLTVGPNNAPATILLTHGAGAPMDSPAMTAAAEALSTEGLRVARFEFAYMAARRTEGRRKPPPRADRVIGEYLSAVAELNCDGPLIIGGKSMGGRVASMAADALFEANKIAGFICLGYPFHPPSKPDQLRTAHLVDFQTPALIFQGTRDPFGTIEEVPDYALSDMIEVFWLDDGDHDLKPRKKVTGLSAADHLTTVAKKVSSWVADLP